MAAWIRTLNANGPWAISAVLIWPVVVILIWLFKYNLDYVFGFWGLYISFLGLCIFLAKDVSQTFWAILLFVYGILMSGFSFYVGQHHV